MVKDKVVAAIDMPAKEYHPIKYGWCWKSHHKSLLSISKCARWNCGKIIIIYKSLVYRNAFLVLLPEQLRTITVGGQAKRCGFVDLSSSLLLLLFHMPGNERKGVELIFEIRFGLALSDRLVWFYVVKLEESIRIDH